jgi:hypothetical protein
MTLGTILFTFTIVGLPAAMVVGTIWGLATRK